MKKTRLQNGSISIVVIIVLILIVVGAYFIFNRSGSNQNFKGAPVALSTEKEVELAIDTVISKKLTSLSKECLKASPIGSGDGTSSPVMFYEIREVHNKTCGGDPNTSPIVSAVQVNSQTGMADTIDSLVNTDTKDVPKTKEFTVTASNYSFAPNMITVKKGETVKINFVNSVGFHDLKIDEFKVATKKINGGATDSVTFVADKAGSFEFYCSVGSHRAMGMKGTLVVQ